MSPKLYYLTVALTAPLFALAQQEETAAAVPFMYSTGRSYIVVAVIGILFAGIAAYLVHLDRKISRLENEK